jgi:hypothetical protein
MKKYFLFCIKTFILTFSIANYMFGHELFIYMYVVSV